MNYKEQIPSTDSQLPNKTLYNEVLRGESQRETLSDAELLELSRKVGDVYVALTGTLTGKMQFDDSVLNSIDEDIASKLRGLIRSIKSHQERQHLQVSLNELTPLDILAPALQRMPENRRDEFISDSRFRMEEVSTGMYAFYLRSDDLALITSGQALAVKNPHGISFVIIRELKDAESNRINLEENLPHEMHHIGWDFARRDGVIQNSETHEEWKQAYGMFQDELLAKAVSNGSLMGYSHYNVCSTEYAAEAAAKDPNMVSDIFAKVGELNEILYEEIMPALGEGGVRRQDLIYTLMISSSFDELEENLKRMKSVINSNPKNFEEFKPDNGWGRV